MKVTITPGDCDKVNQVFSIMQAHIGPVMNLARIKFFSRFRCGVKENINILDWATSRKRQKRSRRLY